MPVQSATGAVTEYDIPVDDFALRRVHVEGEMTLDIAGPAMVLATSGQVGVESESGERRPIAVGSAVFATADERRLTLRGLGEVFVAQPGPR